MSSEQDDTRSDLEMMLAPTSWPNYLEAVGKGMLPMKRRSGAPGAPALGVLLADKQEDDSWWFIFTPGWSMFSGEPTEEMAALAVTGMDGVCHLLVQAGWVVD